MDKRKERMEEYFGKVERASRELYNMNWFILITLVVYGIASVVQKICF